MTMTTIRPAMYGMQTGMKLLQAMGSDGPAPAPTPAPAPVPDPPPPPVDVDFSVMDTPEKAVMLPILNPAALATLLGGAMVAGSDTPSKPVDVNFTFGASTPGKVTYQIIADNKNPSLVAKGQLGGADFNEKWMLEGQDASSYRLHVMGNIGAYAEDITVTPDQKQNVFHVDGKIADMELHQNISKGGTDQNPYVIADGTLGGVALHQEIRPTAQDPNNVSVNVTGNLGDKPIQSSVSASPDTSAKTLVIQGQGNIAGTDFTVGTSVALPHSGK